MKTVTDEFMRQTLSTTKDYCLVILKATLKRNDPGVDKIAWEHGRRNFGLLEEGVLSIVCPLGTKAKSWVSTSSIPVLGKSDKLWMMTRV